MVTKMESIEVGPKRQAFHFGRLLKPASSSTSAEMKYVHAGNVYLAQHRRGTGAPAKPVRAVAGPVSDRKLLELMARLRDRRAEAGLRESAAKVLGKACSKKNASSLCRDMVVPLLCSSVKNRSEDRAVHLAIAGALGAIGDIRALKPLLAMMNFSNGGNLSYFFEARFAIGKLKNVLPPLIGIVKRNKPSVGWGAMSVLGDVCKGRAAPALCKTSAVPLLISFLKVPAKSGFAASALGDIGDTRAVPHLIRALSRLRAANDFTLSSIIEALGQMKDRRAVRRLIIVLRTSIRPMVRAFAAGALGDIGDRKAVHRLIAALKKDRDGWVRSSAAYALGQIGDRKALAVLKAALKDQEADVRKAAKEAIGKIKNKNRVYVIEQ